MLNFGIIGCGQIAYRHARQIEAIGCKLLAVCDIVEQRAIAFGDLFKAKPYIHLEDLLSEETCIDIVVVCTPNSLHAKHSIDALAAGYHVICEKPMALTVSDCEKMLNQAAAAGKELFVIMQNRFNPPVQIVKNLLKENKLGRIYSVGLIGIWNREKPYYIDSWRGYLSTDGGTLFTQFSHFIDLLYWLVGDVKKVFALSANFAHRNIIEFEDALAACLEFENGAIGSLHFTINSYQKNMEGSLTIVAEKGTIRVGGEYLNTLDYQNVENFPIQVIHKSNQANDYGSYMGTMSNHDIVYQHILDVIKKKVPNELDGYTGLKTISIIEKIYKCVHDSNK